MGFTVESLTLGLAWIGAGVVSILALIGLVVIFAKCTEM